MGKKVFFLYYLSLNLLVIILAGITTYLFAPAYFKDNFSLTSPLPPHLSVMNNKQVTMLDLWLPHLITTANAEEKESAVLDGIGAQSVLMYDLANNKAIVERDIKKRLPMASLTKIMTAIISLENPRSDNSYTVRPEHLVGEDSMGVIPGDKLNLRELLYGLMLNSGNDAAEVLADNSPLGNRDMFVNAMNEKAIALGLKDTNFTNPSGLEGDGDLHTTAYDLLVITRYALENFPLFREVVKTPEYVIEATDSHQTYYLTNETNLLTSYPGVQGVKTGYTPEAGLCLVTYYEKDGKRLIGVLLNSPNRREEMKYLLDYALTD